MGLSGRGGWYHWPASVPASPRVESVPPDRPVEFGAAWTTASRNSSARKHTRGLRTVKGGQEALRQVTSPTLSFLRPETTYKAIA